MNSTLSKQATRSQETSQTSTSRITYDRNAPQRQRLFTVL